MSGWEDVNDTADTTPEEAPVWEHEDTSPGYLDDQHTGWRDVRPEDPASTQPHYRDLGQSEPSQDAYGTPFGGIEEVDGLVYSEQAVSPELAWQQQPTDVPLPPKRERPQPMMPARAEPWKPGPDPTPARSPGDARVVKAMLVTVIPLGVLVALVALVFQIMRAYGL